MCMANKNLMFIGILLLAVVVVAGCQVAYPPASQYEGSETFLPDEELDTLTFKSATQLEEFIKENSGGAVYSGGIMGTMVDSAVMEGGVMEVAVSSKAMVPGVDYSETNVQVEGVDEGDILKTDGNYIYTITGETLFIIKAYPGEEAEVVSQVSIEGSPQGLFINGDKLTVFGNVNNLDTFKKMDLRTRSGLSFFDVYDVSDKENPEVVKEYKFEGRYFRSRMIGNNVYFIVTSTPDYRTFEPMPLMLEDGIKRSMSVSDIHYFPIPYDSTQYATIHAIGLENEIVNSKTLVVEASQNMYMSGDNIYITYTKYINLYFYSFWPKSDN